MVDPRKHLPDYMVISDEAVKAWQVDHLCLCGCGQVTKRNRNRNKTGGYTFFMLGHNWKVTDREAMIAANPRPRLNHGARVRETNFARTMDPQWVGPLVDEYLEKHPKISKDDVARCAGVEVKKFRRICLNTYGRIQKSTYVRIMDAIGEPLHKEWEQYRPKRSRNVAA